MTTTPPPGAFEPDSTYARNRRLQHLINEGVLSDRVTTELIPNGVPLAFEKVLWDYKECLPTLPTDRKASEEEKLDFNVSISEIVKDIVAFYNSFGGYIVFGIKDNPKTVIGCKDVLDCGDLQKRIAGATRYQIDLHFSTVTWTGKDRTVPLGVLLIPKRPEGISPAQFLKDAPKSGRGKQAYKTGQIFFRQGDACKPTENSEDLMFLCAGNRRDFYGPLTSNVAPALSNNLGSRDPGFIKFVGREAYLRELWQWLCDPYNPLRLLTGPGGVGKTTLAREFAEDVVRSAPLGLENLVWLSAKKQSYQAILGKYKPSARIDFEDLNTLLRALLLELGTRPEELEDDWSRQDLEDQIVESLQIIPSLIVIDDIDSLTTDEQHDLFHTVIRFLNRQKGRIPSRGLLTSRLDLGASPSQFRRVSGLLPADFAEYVAVAADSIGLTWRLSPTSQQMKDFHKTTDGSPIFASSILRLIHLGETLESALKKWTGAQGEEVRRFTFDRELEQLSESQLRTLYAACGLKDTSFVELLNIVQSSETLLQDDIGKLRSYHLLSLASDSLEGGARLIVPSGIELMHDILRKRVPNPSRIDGDVRRARASTPKLSTNVGNYVHRVVALWRESRPDDALQVAQEAVKKSSSDPDLRCLLGRAYLTLKKPESTKADAEFRKAYDLGCAKAELFGLWFNAKTNAQDWVGLLEVTELAKARRAGDTSFHLHRAKAHWALTEIAQRSGNLNRAAEYALAGGRELSEVLNEEEARGKLPELFDYRAALLEAYVRLTDRMTTDALDHLQVWSAMIDAFNLYVRRPSLIYLGMNRLRSWWSAVELRGSPEKARSVLLVQLGKLNAIASELDKAKVVDPELSDAIGKLKRELNMRVRKP